MTLLTGRKSVPIENVSGVKKKSKRKESRYGKRYGLELKLRCVKLRWPSWVVRREIILAGLLIQDELNAAG